jgi:cell division septal protein FtsQ
VKRALAALVVVIVLAVAVYWFAVREKTVEAKVTVPQAVARIGAGSAAVAVSQEGKVVGWLPLPKSPELPALPLDKPPKGGRVKGPVLEQVKVLAAAPDALRPYLAGTGYDEKKGGVEVETSAGIELLFGDASQAKQKWHTAASILADPTITALDYVDLQAPSRPSYGGEEHELPPAP